MQLEIKTIVDFGDDGPPTDKMDDILRAAHDLVNTAVGTLAHGYGFYLEATTNMGWTSSGDDEE